MSDIELEIILPNKTALKEEAGRVVVPASHGNLTVLPERAPTTLLLENGVVDIWDENNVSVKKYFIQGGVANIAADKCTLITQKAINSKDINRKKAQELKYKRYKKLKQLNQAFPDKKVEDNDSDSIFYEFIYQYFLSHPDDEE